MSVVNVEICCRIPSFSASAVVRSARICFNRRDARLNDEAAAAATESADPPAVDGEARSGGADPHTLAVDDEPRVDRPLSPWCRAAARRPSPTRCGSNPTRKLSTPTRKRTSLRELRRRERADVLALERQRHRLVDESARFGDSCFGSRQSSASARRGSARARAFASPARAARSSAASRSLGLDRVARLRGEDRERPPAGDDLRAARLRAARARAAGQGPLRRAAARAPGRLRAPVGSDRPAAGPGGGTSRDRPERVRHPWPDRRPSAPRWARTS